LSFERPTLAELADRIESDFVTRLALVGAVLRRAIVRVMARVWAGAAHMLHGHLDFLARQLFPDTSESEYLVRQGGLFGITKTPAAFAQGLVTFTGTNLTEIPSGTVVTRSDGVTYATRDTDHIAGADVDIFCIATVAALDGDCDAGTELTLESPITGVDSTATVLAGLTSGADEESDDDYRVRVLERMQEPPHGGNEADYIAWAKEVSGVTRAWVYPEELGPGTVVVRFVRDDDASPIPDSGEVDDVQTKLDTEKPVHATVTAVAPTSSLDVFTIAIVPDTADTRAAVEAELVDLYLRDGEPGATMLLSAIRTAIGTAAGITDYTLTVPAASVTHTTNQLPTVGTITWV
jgi:uncharacterized phage protein gp47/JayE